MSTNDQSNFIAALLVGLTVAVLPAAAAAEPETQSPPEVVRAPAEGGVSRPVWISVREAASPGKSEVDLSLLSERERLLVESQLLAYRQVHRGDPLATPVLERCAGIAPNQADYYVPHPSVEDLAAYSSAVFSGTVKWAQQGLHRGSPATLYGISVEKIWKYDERVRVGDLALVSFPMAQIKVSDAWLCTRNLRHPAAPSIGSRFLLFSSQRSGHPDPIYAPIEQELFFEEDGGKLSLPWHLVGKLDATRLSQIEDGLKDILGAPEVTR